MQYSIRQRNLIILATTALILFYNYSFFNNVVEIYPVSGGNILFLVSLFVALGAVILFLFTSTCFRYTTKPVLILIFIISSITAYFMDSFEIVINKDIINDIAQTNIPELLDLLSIKLFIYFFVLGLVPAIYIYFVKIEFEPLKRTFIYKSKIIGICLVLFVSQLVIFGSYYASFIREHKTLRFYTNPTYYLYSTGRFFIEKFPYKTGQNNQLVEIGKDAIIPDTDKERELVILVVGETARADKFSLNGYKRNTNPMLEKENLVSFTNVYSCGTSTAVSVPCMFSIYNHTDFDTDKSGSVTNVLDVLAHSGVNVLWRDNNSDSKGVARRVAYQDFKKQKVNPDCDIECRDEGMLSGLQYYINKHNSGDILIVLHQMGNHGPDYYKRYPESFEKFTPACHTNQLNDCSTEEVNNAYDNAILYTDYFLSTVINFLKQNSRNFETTMIYMSDHGESLGENHLYLHGMPYLFAPEEQKHVATIIWTNKNNDDIDMNKLKKMSGMELSHDNLFHTLLGIMEVKTTIYNSKLDILHIEKNLN